MQMSRKLTTALLLSTAWLGLGSEARAEAVAVSGRDGNLTRACAGADAAVIGAGNQVTLVGPCRSLRIEGDGNVVAVELARGGTIGITGNSNSVVYAPAGPPPLTTLRGYYDVVIPGPASPAPTTLMLDGALGRRDVHCDGLDVIVRESDARYVLRGGCRSVSVEGQRDLIAAELMPAARLVIGGVGVVVNYVLTAEGPPPVVVVTAPGAQATHLARFGGTAFKLPADTGAAPR